MAAWVSWRAEVAVERVDGNAERHAVCRRRAAPRVTTGAEPADTASGRRARQHDHLDRVVGRHLLHRDVERGDQLAVERVAALRSVHA